MEPDKKIAAAISAVMRYIQTEEEIIAHQTMAASAAVPEATTAAPTKMWALSGRQAIMQMRHLMQMKTFR